MLADLGATVVHVDPPSGPLWDSPANATLNRNKLIVKVDLKTQEGLAEAQALISEADIAIENFRPGVLGRLGIDFAALRKVQPKLITVSIPGFAANDELRREWRAFESVIAAASGVFTDMGMNRVLMGATPFFTPLPISSAYGCLFAAAAAVLALQARERSGVGDQIEVPLASALMEGLAWNSFAIEDLPARYKMDRRRREIARRREAGLPMDLSYDALHKLLDPFYRNYKCQDGRGFYVVAAGNKFHTKRILQLLGLYDELVTEGLVEGSAWLPSDEWPSDTLLGAPLPGEWPEKIADRMQAVFLTRPAKEWERMFEEARLAGAAQRSLQEWIEEDHTRKAGLAIVVDDPVYGQMIQPGPVAWLEESGSAMLTPNPRKWVTFEEALAALSATSSSRPQALSAASLNGWLDGVRVLDMSNVLAGPQSASYLARFGAEIIKLDPVTPSFSPWIVISAMISSRGKSSTLVDITTPGGRKVFERLVKSVDVVIWNATERQVQNMALDPDSLRKINPQAIFCRIDCFGGVRQGSLSDRVGYDDLVQTTSGIMLRFGGSMETPEEHAHVGTIDLLGGVGAILAIGVALYQRGRVGRAGRPRTSLSAVAGLLQIPFWYDYKGRGPFDEPAGPEARGYDALTRLYKSACGSTVMLSATERDMSRFAEVEGLELLADVPKNEWTPFLTEAFGKASAEEWLSRLHAADIGAAICDTLAALRSANTRLADGTPGTEQGSYSFATVVDHPSGYAVTQVDQYAIRPVLGKVYDLSASEKFGASTRNVLRSFQYTEAAITELIAVGAVSEGWSREFLPR
ncbi:dimethylsulfoniopropionate cleavage enzyme DddD [Bradyrhizobium shewense]|uniref:Dimethylsulfoniopropionate cleavage enzyme DddD n=2 Tax=Bradyrhizobium shewense TaxID=1761772 RepID=A0A1C3XUZ1_9BRAD|nr:dimethylsulfoniopropionate cleavage enzyme DddD [Bradyrhizobium shewense]